MTKEEIKKLTDQYKYVQKRVYDIDKATAAMKEVERHDIICTSRTTGELLERIKLFCDIDERGFACFIQKKMMEFAKSFIAEKTKELEEYNVSAKGESHEVRDYRKCIEEITYIIDSVRSGTELLVKIGYVERYEVLNYPVDREDLLIYLESQKEYAEKGLKTLIFKQQLP